MVKSKDNQLGVGGEEDLNLREKRVPTEKPLDLGTQTSSIKTYPILPKALVLENCFTIIEGTTSKEKFLASKIRV